MTLLEKQWSIAGCFRFLRKETSAIGLI